MSTSWQDRQEVFLETSRKRLEDISKTYNQDEYIDLDLRRLEDVLWRIYLSKVKMFVLIKTSSRCIQDLFWRRRRKTSPRRFQDECLLVPVVKSILKFIRPSAGGFFNCHNPKRIKFITRLWLGLSLLPEHNFKHSFQDSFNPFCNCRLDIESSAHYLLHCPMYMTERSTLLSTIENIDNNLLNLCEPVLIKALLIGNNSFDTNANPNVHNAAIEYVLSTKRFEEPHFQWKHEIFKQRYEYISYSYTLNLFIEHSGEHWWEQNIFCSFTTPQVFWQSSAPGALSTLVTSVTSVVLYSLTRATLMSSWKDSDSNSCCRLPTSMPGLCKNNSSMQFGIRH